MFFRYHLTLLLQFAAVWLNRLWEVLRHQRSDCQLWYVNLRDSNLMRLLGPESAAE